MSFHTSGGCHGRGESASKLVLFDFSSQSSALSCYDSTSDASVQAIETQEPSYAKSINHADKWNSQSCWKGVRDASNVEGVQTDDLIIGQARILKSKAVPSVAGNGTTHTTQSSLSSSPPQHQSHPQLNILPHPSCPPRLPSPSPP